MSTENPTAYAPDKLGSVLATTSDQQHVVEPCGVSGKLVGTLFLPGWC